MYKRQFLLLAWLSRYACTLGECIFGFQYFHFLPYGAAIFCFVWGLIAIVGDILTRFVWKSIDDSGEIITREDKTK